MGETIPRTTWQWNLAGSDGVASLKYSEQPVPELSDHDVLVKIKAVSLNPRDIMISKGNYPFGTPKADLIPGSDGAGTVLAVGKKATRFQPGDDVVTTLFPANIPPGSLTDENVAKQLGATVDGTFRNFGIFDEEGLLMMPGGLSFEEAATLSCSGVTAWNAVFGHLPVPLKPSDIDYDSDNTIEKTYYVLTQGTGSVSLTALKFAKALIPNVKVIATTGSEAKQPFLRSLGADHVINYRDTPRWGEEAKKWVLSDSEGRKGGVDLVIDVVGPKGLAQSAKALKLNGRVSVVGAVGDIASANDEDEAENEMMPSLLNTWMNLFTARGVWVGNRDQMEDMCRAIDANADALRPVVDPSVFKLHELREAYEYLESGQNLGKICVTVE